jgi:hypothetical protein
MQDHSLLYGGDGGSQFDMYQVAQARRVGILIPGHGPAAYSGGEMYNVATGSLSGYAVDSQGDSAGTTNTVTDGSISGFVWPSTGNTPVFSAPESISTNSPDLSSFANTYENIHIAGAQGSAVSYATAANGDTSIVSSSFTGNKGLLNIGLDSPPEWQNIAGSGNGVSVVNTDLRELIGSSGSFQISAENSADDSVSHSGSGIRTYSPYAYIDRGPGSFFDSDAGLW